MPGIVCIVLDETFTICSGQTSLMDTDFRGQRTLLFWWENVPREHAASNPEVFWLQPVMAITTSMQPESSRIAYAGSNFTHPFQLHFSKESMDHNVQNQPRSDLDGLVRVWPNKSGLEASWCAGIIGPGFWQDASSPLPVWLLVLNSVPFFHRRPR